MKFSKKDINKQANWWSGSSGRIELEMTLEQAASVSGQGQHDEDARWLVKELRPILDKIDPKVLASELKEYGAWDDKQLADHGENLQRLVWIAGNDIIERENEPEETTEFDVENLPTMDVEQAKDDLLTQLSIETDPEKKKSLERRYKHLTMASLKKQAGLEPGTKVKVHPTTPGLIQSYPATKWLTEPMEVELIDYAPNAHTLDVLDVKLPDGREESIYDFNIDEVVSIPSGKSVSPSPTEEELVNVETLPTLDKPKKIDELLEQLSIETNPTKKEQIKQHIERIKRAKLLKADNVLGDPMSPIQPAIDRGQQEVSKFDPEYEFLVRLVKLISKTSPEAVPEIKALSQAFPFHTIDDVGDLTAKIWTLATTKYNIPRAWLISKLPEKKGSLSKKAKIIKMEPREGGVEFPVIMNPTFQETSGLLHKSPEKTLRYIPGNDLYVWDAYNAEHVYVVDQLSQLGYPLKGYHGMDEYFISDEEIKKYFKTNKKADLWPAQESASEGTCSQAPGQIAYNPTQEKDLSVSGPTPQDVANEDALWDIVVNEFFIAHKRWSEVIKVLRSAYPEVTDSVILSLKDRVKKSLDNQMGMIGSSKKVAKRHLNMDQVIKILDSKENKVDHIDFTNNTLELVDHTILTFDEATQKAVELDKTAEGEFTGAEFSTDAVGVNPSMDSGPWSSPEDHGAKPQKGSFPSLSWQPAGAEDQDEQPYSNIASSMKLSKLDIKANPQSRYWIAPDGKEFDAGTHHGGWIKTNKQILKQYGIPFTHRDMVWVKMMEQGWVRISNEPAGTGFQIDLQDIKHVPSFLDNFIARNFSEGDVIKIGSATGYVEITDPFPSIQKAVNKALRNPVNASKKQAAISGKIVRDILEIVQSSGGITYSLSKGNLSGTDNYSVSVYPDREVINPGVVEFDDIQHYLDTNEDLLSQSDNSLGIWSHNNNQIYYDVVVTIPDKEEALKLAREHNQLAIWDLKNMVEIPTGIVRAFSKKTIVKIAEESPLTEEQANMISAASCPAYVMAINNFYNANSRGHDKDRSLAYAIDSVKNLEKIDEKKLVEFINTYLGPVK